MLFWEIVAIKINVENYHNKSRSAPRWNYWLKLFVPQTSIIAKINIGQPVKKKNSPP